MKLKSGYKVRELAGEYMLIPIGVVDTKALFSLSESAAWLWNALRDKDFDVDSAVGLITAEYEIDEKTARADVLSLIEKWRENSLIDG